MKKVEKLKGKLEDILQKLQQKDKHIKNGNLKVTVVFWVQNNQSRLEQIRDSGRRFFKMIKLLHYQMCINILRGGYIQLRNGFRIN